LGNRTIFEPRIAGREKPRQQAGDIAGRHRMFDIFPRRQMVSDKS
jgi:hypothetical protein